MKTKGLILIIVVLLGNLSLQAQDTPVLILVEGRVLGLQDSLPVTGVHIWGGKRSVGAVSDSAGWFSIYAYTTDTLVFSAVGYGEQRQPIPMEAALQHVTFWLEETGYSIDEVTVLPFTKAGFKKAFMEVELPPDRYAINLNLPKLPKLSNPNKAPLSRPLEIMLGIITLDIYAIAGEKIVFKERWEQKQVDKWEDREQYLNRIAEKYNPTFVKQIVPVSDAEVGPFLKFCDLRNEFVAAATEYEIGVAIKECYMAWVEAAPAEER